MSFRRDRETELEWRRWVLAHETELIAIGIPREVWADRLAWWRFVEEGYHPASKRPATLTFAWDDLPPDRQERLYRFLDATLPESRYGYSLWTVLHNRFGAAADQHG